MQPGITGERWRHLTKYIVLFNIFDLTAPIRPVGKRKFADIKKNNGLAWLEQRNSLDYIQPRMESPAWPSSVADASDYSTIQKKYIFVLEHRINSFFETAAVNIIILSSGRLQKLDFKSICKIENYLCSKFCRIDIRVEFKSYRLKRDGIFGALWN